MRRIIFFSILVLIILVVAFLIYSRKEDDVKYCKVDEDCVPASCCHSNDCVNVNNKPDCKEIVCSMICSPGTMDCGQGHCICVNNECKAIIE